jgi:hypothetical protein
LDYKRHAPEEWRIRAEGRFVATTDTAEFEFPRPPLGEGGGKCLYCGKEELIADVQVLGRRPGGETTLKVGKNRDPDVLVFVGRERPETVAKGCRHRR